MTSLLLELATAGHMYAAKVHQRNEVGAPALEASISWISLGRLEHVSYGVRTTRCTLEKSLQSRRLTVSLEQSPHLQTKTLNRANASYCFHTGNEYTGKQFFTSTSTVTSSSTATFTSISTATLQASRHGAVLDTC
jgi:hypothetical protein